VKRAALLLTAGLLAGCVRDAVLENDVLRAQWNARTLATATDPTLAYAALSAQLVELEALYQRDSSDRRIRSLLERGYLLMGRGFIELRRLTAAASADSARAEQEAQLRADAERRAAYYAADGRARIEFDFDRMLRGAQEACASHDRAGYERRLNEALAQPERAPEARLELALGRRLAALWLAPNVAARCGFATLP
jgi:hypothetical protein